MKKPVNLFKLSRKDVCGATEREIVVMEDYFR
jgi:hypothetical protein